MGRWWGGILAEKAAQCFCPLHAMCALVKVGDWRFYKLASPNSFPHVILWPWNVYSLVICFNLSFCRKPFPPSSGWGWAPRLCSAAGDCMPVRHHPSHHMLQCFCLLDLPVLFYQLWAPEELAQDADPNLHRDLNKLSSFHKFISSLILSFILLWVYILDLT